MKLFNGNYDDFTITRNLNGVVVDDNRTNNNEGEDQLSYVETFKFDDLILDFSNAPWLLEPKIYYFLLMKKLI